MAILLFGIITCATSVANMTGEGNYNTINYRFKHSTIGFIGVHLLNGFSHSI